MTLFNEPIIPNLEALRGQSLKGTIMEINEPYTAKNIFYQIAEQIKRFEAILDYEHEVGMKLVSFGQSIQFSVTSLSYMNPSLIWFEGILPDGSNVQLIQHVNQLSFLMVAVKRPDPEQVKNPIGFYPDQLTSLESSESR